MNGDQRYISPMAGPKMKPAALAPPMIPATAPCSCGETVNDDAAAKAGRATPKPRPDRIIAKTKAPKVGAARNRMKDVRPIARPKVVSCLAEKLKRCTTTSCANKAAIDEAI